MEILKSGIIFNFIMSLYTIFINSFNNSFLKRILSCIKNIFVESYVYKRLSLYVNKKPYFLNSSVYKTVDFVLNKVYNCLSKPFNAVRIWVKESCVYKICHNIKKGILFLGQKLLTHNSVSAYVVGRVLVGINKSLTYEGITYFLGAFILIDYLLRLVAPPLGGVWDELLLIVMFMFWGYKFLKEGMKAIKHTPLDLPVMIFIFFMFSSLFFKSPDFKVGIEGLRAVIQYVIWYFVVLNLLKDEKGGERVVKVLVLTAGLLALHGIYQYAAGVEMPAGWVDSKEAGLRTRVFSIIGSPNIMGSFMAMCIPLAFSFFNNAEKKNTKLFYLFLTLCMCISLVFTFSRGAWIGFVVAVMVYVLLKDKRLLLPVIILCLLVVFFVPSVGSRITYMLSSEYIESSLRGGRLVRWGTGLEFLSNNLAFGLGLGHFGGAVATNNALEYVIDFVKTKVFYMDNYFLKTAVETGLFGFSAFFVLMYEIILNSVRTIKITADRKQKELETGMLAGISAVITHNFFENVFEVPMMTTCFYLLVAVMMHLWYLNYHREN